MKKIVVFLLACMLLMGSAHIGEVQSGIWDEETKRICAEAGVRLL